MTAKATITTTGPLFRADPAKRILENARDLLEQMAEYGEERVQEQIASKAGSMPAYTGFTRAQIRGRVESTSGKRWMRHAVVSADTSGMDKALAIRTKAAAATIESRWHPFRRTGFAMRALIRKADLTRGLN